MPKISSQEAVEKIGNRYNLVLIASQRARELNNGSLPKVKTKNGSILTALTEIEEGLIGKDYLKRIR